MSTLHDGLFDGEWIEVARSTGRERRTIRRHTSNWEEVLAIYSAEHVTKTFRKVTDAANLDLSDIASTGSFNPVTGTDPRTTRVILDIDKSGVATMTRMDVTSDPKLKFESVMQLGNTKERG